MKRLIKAFGYSCDGLRCAIKSEAAFRQEIILLVAGIVVALLIDFSALERIALIGSLILVMITEIINTAFEYVIERISNDWHEASKKVKDLGSAAVLLALVLAAGTWVSLLAVHFIS